MGAQLRTHFSGRFRHLQFTAKVNKISASKVKTGFLHFTDLEVGLSSNLALTSFTLGVCLCNSLCQRLHNKISGLSLLLTDHMNMGLDGVVECYCTCTT